MDTCLHQSKQLTEVWKKLCVWLENWINKNNFTSVYNVQVIFCLLYLSRFSSTKSSDNYMSFCLYTIVYYITCI